MFGIGASEKEQVCGFVIIVDNKESKNELEYQNYCINELESIINSSDINIESDMTILGSEITIKSLKNKNKNRVYLPVEYYSEKDAVKNRKEFRNKLSSREGISVIYNKKTSIK